MKQRKIVKKLAAMLAVCTFTMTMLVGCSGKISNDLITINKYKGLEVENVTVAEVSDEDVESSIQSTLYTIGTENVITDRAVQEGDFVVIDYVGTVDGVAFTGGTADDQTLEIGSDSYIDGFEDAIIGHKTGETFDINVTFPENYSEDLSGKDAVFTITLDKIYEWVVPELTDELVVSQLSTTATTIEEYRAEQKANLETSNKEAAESEFLSKVWNALLDNCVVEEFPEDELADMITGIEAQYGTVASMYGIDVDTFIQSYYGITEQEMAENLLKQRYAIELIAEKEEITLTVAEYEAELEEYASRWGYTSEEMEELVGHDELELMFIQERVGEWLVENCKRV